VGVSKEGKTQNKNYTTNYLISASKVLFQVAKESFVRQIQLLLLNRKSQFCKNIELRGLHPLLLDKKENGHRESKNGLKDENYRSPCFLALTVDNASTHPDLAL